MDGEKESRVLGEENYVSRPENPCNQLLVFFMLRVLLFFSFCARIRNILLANVPTRTVRAPMAVLHLDSFKGLIILSYFKCQENIF